MNVKEFLLHLIIKLLRKIEISCPICKNDLISFDALPDYYFKMFDKNQFIHSIFNLETFNYLKYSCPICGCSDRNRLYALYFNERFTGIKENKSEYQFLDIAPDRNLSEWIKKLPFIHYRSVDLYMEDVDDHADITDLSLYETDKFDIILCSHVLEHIENDRKALAELFRILKPGGFAIVMAPILLTLNEDLENPKWTTEADRWKYYGQDDHVRMYSKDGFVKKLSETGFKVNQLGIDFFGDKIFKKNGIHPRSVLYEVEK
jgi:SAM-dependent methyltransferase